MGKLLYIRALAGAVAVAALGGALLSGCERPAVAAAAAPTAASAGGAEQLKRGRYLAKAADCAACHTSAGGAPFAGGVELKSPFGTFYGTNITPDKENGIGKWSAAEFYRALHDGVTPDKHLYPAMPYTSYRSMTREDSDAIYAYLMQTRPVALKSRDADLSFPYNMRFGVRFWNMLFLEDSLPDASIGASAAWQRGRYLNNTLGHCAECHTPRGMLGQLDLSKTLSGNVLARIGAPDITPAGLAAAGWTGPDLASFLGTGVAPQGSAYGEMFAVVHLSTQYLVPADLAAMTTYLLGDKPLAPQALKPVAVAAAELDAGRNHYIAVCAGCHAVDGGGKPHVAVAMRGNTTVRSADPHNLIAVILDGIEAQHFGAKENMQDMPGFAGTLSDKDIADLSNFMRMSWGGQGAKVSEGQVTALRAQAGGHH
ncbi:MULTISPECIES: c-type cytochrome [unclassified Janthinobacterium]|uniref:c-type cytochrome n=1 Tax=unclassified Janthinobacterium TaxID=2610881 RepID=UPI00034B74DD|nr:MULTISPECIES: c-type cytochrome [unclassified Janthinobacterium]MEC5160863.1 mono/diheme cytochrome c family protein [Janthinobacterium sp. CG_S6]